MDHDELTPIPGADGPESERLDRPPRDTPQEPGLKGDASEQELLHDVVRALLRAEEKHRLYPEGHQQVRRALKDVLSAVQAFALGAGKSFSFVTDSALGLMEAERTPRARDMAALAYPCRIRRIARITIPSDADLEALEILARLLHLPRDDEDPEESSAELARAAAPRIEIEFVQMGVAEEGYLFDADGQQLFGAAASPTLGSSQIAEDLPLPVRRILSRIFSSPSVVQRLEACRDRLLRAAGPATSGTTDLVSHIVRSVFDDPATLIDTPEATIEERVLEFLQLFEGIGSSNAARREGARPPPLPPDAQEILRRAIGLGSGAPTGLASVLREWSPPPPETAGPVPIEPDRRPSRPPSLADVESLFPETDLASEGVRHDVSARAPSGTQAISPLLPPDVTDAAEPAPRPRSGNPMEPHPLRRSAPSTGSFARPRAPIFDFSSIRSIPLDTSTVRRSITRHPWDLEALRVREEILVADPPEDGGDPRLDRLVRALTGFAWPDDNAFAQELERIEELIGARGPGGTIIERALARQPSEGRVDAWFRKRADRGAEIAEVRPALAAVAASDSKRSVNALVHFWRKAERARRNDWVEEVFRLHGEADAIAFWAKRCPQGFGSSHAQRILSTLPTRLLRGICERLLEDGDARGIVESPALLTCLRSIAKSSDAEVWIAHTIDRSPPSLRRDLLAVVDTCSTRELFTILERILERENERNDPDPELVHLALSALRKSSLPHARNLLRRIRTERKRLRYTFSRPIREILLLLDKLDEVGP